MKQRNNNWWQPDFQLWSQAGVTNHSLLVHTSLDAPGDRHRCTDLKGLWDVQQQENSHFPVPSPLLPVRGARRIPGFVCLGTLGSGALCHWTHTPGDCLSQKEQGTATFMPEPGSRVKRALEPARLTYWLLPNAPDGYGAPALY